MGISQIIHVHIIPYACAVRRVVVITVYFQSRPFAQGSGQGIRAAIFDVDGVLTDGRLFIGEAGEVFKAFHVLDGHGLKLLAQAGITPIIITGRDSAAVRRRVSDLDRRVKRRPGIHPRNRKTRRRRCPRAGSADA